MVIRRPVSGRSGFVRTSVPNCCFDWPDIPLWSCFVFGNTSWPLLHIGLTTCEPACVASMLIAPVHIVSAFRAISSTRYGTNEYDKHRPKMSIKFIIQRLYHITVYYVRAYMNLIASWLNRLRFGSSDLARDWTNIECMQYVIRIILIKFSDFGSMVYVFRLACQGHVTLNMAFHFSISIS